MSRQESPNDNNNKTAAEEKKNSSAKSPQSSGKFRLSIAQLWCRTKRLFHTEREPNGNAAGSQEALEGNGCENNGNSNHNNSAAITWKNVRIEWESFLLQICQLHEWKQSRSIMRKVLILVKVRTEHTDGNMNRILLVDESFIKL